MEGPSLYLVVEQLEPFIEKIVDKVSGNTKTDKERLINKKILSIFSFGKYLFFQFDTFALRIHFLLYGSLEATVKRKKVTGNFLKKKRTPRLSIQLNNGHIEMYNCSIRFIEESNAKANCDFSIDIMSESWDSKEAFKKIKKLSSFEIDDILLDQTIFAGVGNIIKNEVLLLAKTLPTKKVEEITDFKLKKIINLAREFSFHFYEWRKKFVLKKHYQIYRQSFCKKCGSKVKKIRTGIFNRISFICPNCEK